MKRPDAHPFAIGQNVRHAKFGEGVVLNFEGSGLDARVQVRFRGRGHEVARRCSTRSSPPLEKVGSATVAAPCAGSTILT